MKALSTINSNLPSRSSECPNPVTKQPVGRPRCRISSEQVRQLRDEGMSWRGIARVLGIGSATARRLYSAISRGVKVCQNSGEAAGRFETHR